MKPSALSWIGIFFLFAFVPFSRVGAAASPGDSTISPTLQQALRAAKWWQLNRNAQAVRLWVWELKDKSRMQFRIDYKEEKPVLVLPPISKSEFREIAPWLAQSMERGSSYYIPENVREYLNLQQLPVRNKVGMSVSVSELARSVAKGIRQMLHPPGPADLEHMKLIHLRALQILWENNPIKLSQWYLALTRNYPDHRITFEGFRRVVDFLHRAHWIQIQLEREPDPLCLARLGELEFKLLLEDKLRYLDPVRFPERFQHFNALLEALEQGETAP
ncbi:MAG: hypothetical protein D6715_06975 [Calditrichaeota bacterium]|nr:MAG: hypothetical protein D6715_06975 [Calditrichota bacterium]